MYKLKIFSIGKTKEPWLIEAIEEYTKRLRPILSIEWVLSKDERQLKESLDKESSYIALDSKGESYNSEAFSQWLIVAFQKENSRLNIVIGGATGFSEDILIGARTKISLSKLTFTHQLTRLVLLEQIYRAFEIEKGSQYHK
jgi:23S rRNA (pseudouridine1915-N3)-methyltransferase